MQKKEKMKKMLLQIKMNDSVKRFFHFLSPSDRISDLNFAATARALYIDQWISYPKSESESEGRKDGVKLASIPTT